MVRFEIVFVIPPFIIVLPQCGVMIVYHIFSNSRYLPIIKK